jgi:hypothetical protein
MSILPILSRHFLLLISIISIGHAQNLKFETLSQENVLDKQAVLTIAQDKQGKLWFGGGANLLSMTPKYHQYPRTGYGI